MKRVKDLLHTWQAESEQSSIRHPMTINLSREHIAKLNALQEMFPGVTLEALLQDLLSASLTEIEASMPYVPGNNVISEDELGDPVFEDIGPFPMYHQLTKKHLGNLDS